MATRIYTQSSGAVGVTPSTWNFASQISPVTVPGTTTKNTGSAMTSTSQASSATSPHADALGRTVIGPLAAQTISGTIKAQMRGSESNAGANATLALAVKIIKPDGTDRAVLLAQTASDSSAAPNELVTTLTNAKFEDTAESAAITLTSQTPTAGDYLVIEWGVRTATTVSRTIVLSYGNDSATDLPEDTTTTAANNPWFEFSGAVGFQITPTPGAGSVSVSGLAALLAATLAVGAGSIGLSGTNVGVGFQLPTTGSIDLTGQAATSTITSFGSTITVPAGAVTLDGQALTFAGPSSTSPSPAAATLAITGQTPTPALPIINVPVGAITLTGLAEGVSFQAPATGALTIAGLAPSAINAAADVVFAMPAGSLALTGQQPNLSITGLNFRYRASLYSTGQNTTYPTSGTYTPAANSLLVAFVSVSGSQVAPPTVAGHGVSWTSVTLSAHNLSTTHRLDCFIANSGSSPTAAAFTVSGYSGNQTGCVITEFEVIGAYLSGGLSAAVIQSPTNTGGPGTSGTVTLSAGQSANNRPLAFFVHLANEASTARTNWTLETGAFGGYSSPATGAIGEYRSDAFETTASASWTSSALWRGIALEIAASGSSIPVGAISLSGQAPVLLTSEAIPVGAIALTGRAPVAANDASGIPAGSLSLTGLSVGVAFGTPSTGAIAISGLAPIATVGAPVAGTIPVGTGSIAFDPGFFDVLFEGPDTGTLTLTGLAPIIRAAQVQPPVGAIAVSGLAPITARGAGMPVGSLALTGRLESIASGVGAGQGQFTLVGQALSPALGTAQAVGSLVLTGQAPLLTFGATTATLTPGAGSIALSGQAPAVQFAGPGLGAITLTGLTPVAATAIIPPAGNVAFTGLLPVIGAQRDIPVGAVALVGLAPGLSASIGQSVAAVVLSGQAPSLSFGDVRAVPLGSVGLLGAAPSVLTYGIVDVPAGSVALTGTVTQSQFGAIPIGAITLTGQAPAANTTITLPAGNVIAISGVPVTQVGSSQQADPLLGALTITGLAPTFDTLVQCTGAALTLDGQAPTPAHVVAATQGAITITGRLPIAGQAFGSRIIAIGQGSIELHSERISVSPRFRRVIGHHRSGGRSVDREA